MKIKTFEKVEVDTLHVAGVEASLVTKFKEITDKTGAPGSFYMNQMLADFVRSAEKKTKQEKQAELEAAKKAAA